MKIREQAKQTLESLHPKELLTVYEMMLSIKGSRSEKRSEKAIKAYKKARAALKNCTGNMSDDIIQLREDRI